MRAVLSVGLRFPLAVVVAWVLAAATLSLLVTPLATVVERSSTAFLPEDSPTLKGLRVMDSEFGSGRTESYVFIVIADEDGLDDTDQRLYRTLGDTGWRRNPSGSRRCRTTSTGRRRGRC